MEPKFSTVPECRWRTLNQGPVNPAADWVLYWMIANRRAHWNYSLQRAADWAQHLNLPLLVLEALRCDYRWASDRIHWFLIQGMKCNARAFENSSARYWPYLEPARGEGRGLLKALADRAALVVSDDFPCFFLPEMLRAAAKQVAVRLEVVDSNGLYPMRDTERVFHRAVDFRRHLQKNLLSHLPVAPDRDPLKHRKLPRLDVLPQSITQRWQPAPLDQIVADGQWLAKLPLDHQVRIVETQGGSDAASAQLKEFVDHRLDRYAEARNQPDERVASELSPYLHFGHLSAHEVFQVIADRESWHPASEPAKATGSSSGWWGMSLPSESFLDELVTWRELGYNFCCHRSDYDRYESLPEWALKTLEKHATDQRAWLYDLAQFEQAETHDPLWNAAQRQLTTEGRIHNYLRMLWGKKILEWTRSPRLALEYMIELNNKYALDGRNPNSYSGIFWVLGRYDRPWGPERPVFGTVRYMSSDNTARKVSVKGYLRRYQTDDDQIEYRLR